MHCNNRSLEQHEARAVNDENSRRWYDLMKLRLKERFLQERHRRD